MCTAKRYRLSISSSASLLFLDERGHPEDGYSTDDGRAQLAQDATLGDAKLLEEPAADQTAKESQHKMQRRGVKGYSRAGLLTGYGKDVVGVMVHTAAVVGAQAYKPDNQPIGIDYDELATLLEERHLEVSHQVAQQFTSLHSKRLHAVARLHTANGHGESHLVSVKRDAMGLLRRQEVAANYRFLQRDSGAVLHYIRSFLGNAERFQRFQRGFHYQPVAVPQEVVAHRRREGYDRCQVRVTSLSTFMHRDASPSASSVPSRSGNRVEKQSPQSKF